MAEIVAVLSVVVVASVFWRLTQPVITLTPDPICGKTEHAHTSACYQDVLTCGQEEGEEHSHGSSCYSSVLCCGMSEHAHVDACYPATLEEPTVVDSSEEPTASSEDKEPTEEPTAAPVTEVPTEEPTEEPTQAPTPVPAPVLEHLSASADHVYAGQSVTWSFAVAHADVLTYEIADGTGAVVAGGSLAADVQSVAWTASQAGSYTMTLTAENESGRDSSTAKLTVEEVEELTASVWMDVRSCFVGDSVTVYMAANGGMEPTTVELTVAQDGNVLASQQSISESISVTTEKATRVGKLTAQLTVTDALGTSVEASCEIPVALKANGDADKWLQAADIELGESWPENLLAVAETQLGYQESEESFIVCEDGSRQGYTVYGDWYGCAYQEWCAMFVSFCLDKADVPASAFSRDIACVRWISELRHMDLYADRSDCEPAPGDLVFFDWDGDQHGDHVGIVTDVTETGIETIEGNSRKSVRRCSYVRDDSQIMGYGLLNLAYENYLNETAETEQTVAPTEMPEPTATPEQTVAPTETPEPTATPEQTVAPTETPEPTATPEQTVAPTETPVDVTPSPTQDEPTEVGFDAFVAEIEALPEGDEAALTDLEDRIVAAYDAGELSDEEFAALATALYGGIASYSATDDIIISLVINNSAYTHDTGSGSSHVQIESTDVAGLNTKDFTYTALGTGKAYWVEGTGTLIQYTIPAGTSMSDNDLSFLKLTIANLVDNGTDNNTNRYVSPYSWVDANGKVCSVNTAFDADTTLYLSLYSESEVYYFDYCCDANENHSISGALSSLYPHASVQVGQSVSAEYVPLPVHVNANYNVEGCTHGLANNEVMTSWYILDQSGNEVAFTEGLTILDTYLPTQGNAIKVYAKWEAITADSMVTVSFKMPDGSTASTAVAINTGTALGNLMPENPTMNNCAFLGWSYDGGQTWVDSTTPITNDVTLTAVFNVPVTVYTHDYAGGNTSSEIIKDTYTVQTGKSLAEAVNSEGAHITAEPFIGSYMFLGWHPETYSYGVNTKDLSECIVTGALGVSEVYEKVCTLTFQYTIDGESHIARTYYVKVNGTIYDAMDADGVKPDLYGTMLAPVQVTGYQFNNWFLNGSEYYPSYTGTFNTDTVFTADLTKLNVVSFRQVDVADADGDSDTEEYITIDTRYVAANQALRTAVDENGDAVATLPTAQSTADAAFRQWVDAAGNTVTLDTVITDDVTFTADYSNDFVTVKYVYASDGVEVSVHADSSLLSGTEIAEADMPAQEELTADSYPPNYYLSGWKVMDASGKLADVTWPYTVTADVTTFYAQFEAPLTITFIYMDGTENAVVKVRAGTTFAEVLAANPQLAAEEFIEMTVDGELGYGRFACWTFVAEDDSTKAAADDLVLQSNMTFTASYDVVSGYEITIHDIDPDGNEYVNEDSAEGAEISLLAIPGQSLHDVLVESDVPIHDGSDAADRIWYTVDESDNKTRVNLDANVISDMQIYTYTYRIILVRAGTEESADETTTASVTNFALPSAGSSAYVLVSDDGNTITIELAEGDTLSLSDFIINGVDYSVYSWMTQSGVTYTTSQLIAAVNNENGALHNQNATLTQGTSSLAKVQKTVNFYVCVNNNWVKIETIDYAWRPTGGNKDVLSAALLESIYYDYGFRAADYQIGSCVIGHTHVGNGTIYFMPAVAYDGQTFAEILNKGDGRNCDVYYVPTRQTEAGETNANKSTFTTSDTFYTVTVEDPNNHVYAAGEIPPVQYVLTGRTATVTVKAPEDTESGMGWIISGASSNEKTENDDGTISYTFKSVTAPITIKVGVPGEVLIYYVVSGEGELEQIGTMCSAASQEWYEAAPDVSELTASVVSDDGTSKTFNEALVVSDDGYVVKAPTRETWVSRNDYYANGVLKGDRLFTYRFEGWQLFRGDGTAITDADGNEIVLQPGDTITKEAMAEYASDGMLTFKSLWGTGGSATSSTVKEAQDTVAFYVRVDSTVADTEGNNNATPVGEYSDAVYTTYVVDGDAKISDPNEKENVIVGSSTTNAVEIDAIIRSLYPDGVYGVSIGGFPTDEEVLARLRTWASRAGSGYNTNIELDGVSIPISNLTTANYKIRWFVFKYDNTDAWHIDGLLVPLKGQLRVQKTFYGDETAVEAIQNQTGDSAYNITVTQVLPADSTAERQSFTLNLQEKSDINTTGYTNYNPDTKTYTWVLDVYQAAYTVKENNYDYTGDANIATFAQSSINNSGTSADGQWVLYDNANGVTVTAKAYPTDVVAGTIQTVGLRNSYIPTNTLVIRKQDGATSHNMGNISFKLYKLVNGEYVQQKVYQDANKVYYIYEDTAATLVENGLLTTDANGTLQIVGVSDGSTNGRYKLEEVNPPQGYNPAVVELTVTNGTIALAEGTDASMVGQELHIPNRSKTAQLVVEKNWAEGMETKAVQMQLYGNGISMGNSYAFTLDGTTDTLETEAWKATFSNMPLYVDGAPFVITVKETWIGNTAASDEYADGYEDYVVQYSPLLYTYPDGTSGTQPSKVNEQGETVFATSATLVVTNSSETGDISFTKVDENGNPLPGAEFALYTLYAENMQDEMGEASSGSDGRVTFTDVPYGIYYLMKETQAPSGYLADDTLYKVVVSSNGVKIYAPQLDSDGNVLKDGSGNTIYDESGSLSQIANQPVPVEIVVKKVDNSDKTTPLSGATFQLKKKNATNVYEFVEEKTTGANGTISFTGLLPGVYQLVETAAPAGYYLKAEPIEFTIVPGAVSGADKTIFAVTNEGNVFTVPNQAGSELPQTGGSGTLPYTIGGLLIMAVALLCGYGSRRRHGRGVGRE